MVWRQKGGGGDDPSLSQEETNNLLEDGQEDSTEATEATANQQEAPEEEKPLINDNSISDTDSTANKRSSVAIVTTTTPSSKKTSSSSSNNQNTTTIPIMVTLDPSDRASLNTGSTVSVRTSPAHQSTTATTDTTTSGGGDLPLRSSVINMSRLHHPGSHDDDSLSIQVATVSETVSKPNRGPEGGGGGCTPRAMCGPHPKKVTIVVALVLSIWASFILGVNIHKKVMTMEDRLASMTQKMLDLQFRYLDMQEQSSQEIAQLHNRIAELMGRKNQQKESIDQRGGIEDPKSVQIQLDKRSRIVTTTTTTSTTTKDPTMVCKTETGKTCVLPFIKEGVSHDGCVKKWSDDRAWCATDVDETGKYVWTVDNSSWDYCNQECPPTSHVEEDWTF